MSAPLLALLLTSLITSFNSHMKAAAKFVMRWVNRVEHTSQMITIQMHMCSS